MMRFPDGQKGKCQLSFFIANGGDTDAFVIGYVINLFWHQKGIVFAPEVEERQFIFHNTIINPGARVEIIDTHFFPFKWEDFSKIRLFAIGRVEYEGADQARRITGFCREYLNDSGMWQRVQNDAYEYTY